jgi:hypothetical protein
LITASDLARLIENKVPEGLQLDYKRDNYKHGEDGKWELLKDISGFANASGGHLVIGMDEADGVPKALMGLTGAAEEECAWLTNVCRDCLEPRIVGLEIRFVEVEDNRHAIIARVPRSWNPPHVARMGKLRRFFIRHSASTNEASTEELRMLFTLSSSLQERMRDFRNERIRFIAGDKTPIDIAKGGRFVLHVIPFTAFAEPFSVDFGKLTRGGHNFSPLSGGGYNPIWNFDGYLAANTESPSYSQIFRNGIIEGVVGGILQNYHLTRLPAVYAETVEDTVLEATVSYLSTLRVLDVPPPYAVFASFQGVRGGEILGNAVGFGPRGGPIRYDDLLFPEIILSEATGLIRYREAFRQLFDALWNAAGYQRSASYDRLGQWHRND